MSNTAIIQLLAACEQQQRLQFRTREGLEAYQRRQMLYLLKYVLPASPYYKLLLSKPVEHWPIMNERLLEKYFDIINTCGLRREGLLENGAMAEAGLTPIFTTGTTEPSSLFLLSHEERLQRLGTVLAAIWRREEQPRLNVACFFHTDNIPCGHIEDDALRLEPYDLARPYAELHDQLLAQQPDTIIAPVSFLLRLYEDLRSDNMTLPTTRVYNIGEVLTQRDRLKLRTLFAYVGDIYQAAEGILGITCAHGRLHLNEHNLLIQQEHLENDRFLPVITDFHAHTLPLVQYRLNDILVMDHQPCPCGSVYQVVKRVEGRLEDVLLLPGQARRRVRIYAEYCHEVLLKHLPKDSDYQLVQTTPYHITLRVAAEKEELEQARWALAEDWKARGVDSARLVWDCEQAWGERDVANKRRQVMRVVPRADKKAENSDAENATAQAASA